MYIPFMYVFFRMINRPSYSLIGCFALLGAIFFFDILAIAIPNWVSIDKSTTGIFKYCYDLFSIDIIIIHSIFVLGSGILPNTNHDYRNNKLFIFSVIVLCITYCVLIIINVFYCESEPTLYIKEITKRIKALRDKSFLEII